LDLEKKKLLEQLEQFSGGKFEKIYDGPLDAFAYNFSTLNIDGLDSLLSDYNNYDGVSKAYYLKLIEKAFNNLKSQGITSLLAVHGVCSGCINGCSGFSFVDSKTGVYVDIIVEIKHKEITNFMECYDLKNNKTVSNKTERIIIKHFKTKNNWLYTTDSFGKMEKGVVNNSE
jgi:hypothetical protein